MKPKKNVLYQMTEDDNVVCYEEEHEDGSYEKVFVKFILGSDDYGIFSHEYRPSVVKKEGTKAADILACAVNEKAKVINSYIYDCKRNISSFSDELEKAEALLTAIKNVDIFLKQIGVEILHKGTFLIYFQEYAEEETVGIITKNFEEKKFSAAAERLKKLLTEDDTTIAPHMNIKMKNMLLPYRGMIQKLNDFAQKKVIFHKKEYLLDVILLQEMADGKYVADLLVTAKNDSDSI